MPALSAGHWPPLFLSHHQDACCELLRSGYDVEPDAGTAKESSGSDLLKLPTRTPFRCSRWVLKTRVSLTREILILLMEGLRKQPNWSCPYSEACPHRYNFHQFPLWEVKLESGKVIKWHHLYFWLPQSNIRRLTIRNGRRSSTRIERHLQHQAAGSLRASRRELLVGGSNQQWTRMVSQWQCCNMFFWIMLTSQQ